MNWIHEAQDGGPWRAALIKQYFASWKVRNVTVRAITVFSGMI